MNSPIPEKEVTGCVDCPFSFMYDMAPGFGCNIDSEKQTIKQDKYHMPVTPKWCPLRQTPLLIKFKSK